MAKPNKKAKKTVRSKPETVRERAAKKTDKATTRKRKLPGSDRVAKSPKKLASALNQSVKTHDHKDDSKLSFFTKHRSFVPGYFRSAGSELKNVVWPRLPEALRLTLAVILFAAVFSVLISGLDWVFSKIFEELILNESQNIKEFLKDLF